MQDKEPRVLYGLLVALRRPSCAREGEDDIRCKWWIIRCRPFNFLSAILTAAEVSWLVSGIESGEEDCAGTILGSRDGKGMPDAMSID